MHNVIVTGGSRGLGLCIARRLAAEGYRAVVIARNMNEELAAVIEFAGKGPGAVHFQAFDFGNLEGIPELVKQLHQQFGPIYGLINNAALGSDGALAMMDNTQIEHVIRINTTAPIVLTKYVVRHMLADGGGRIVNVASIVGLKGHSGLSVYGATKAAMIGFTRSLAREVGRMGIHVNAVAPGLLETEMTQAVDNERREKVARRAALRRFANVDDVADTIEFLLGSKAKSITGTVLTVDAGTIA